MTIGSYIASIRQYSARRFNSILLFSNGRNSKGLADAINTSYLPDMLPDSKKKQGTFVYFILIVVYIAFGILSVVSAVRSRFHPSITYSKFTEENSFKSPKWTLCPSSTVYAADPNFAFTTLCNVRYFDNTMKTCDYSTYEILTANGEKCIVFEINEDICALDSKINLWMNVSSNSTLPTDYFNARFISDFKPAELMNWAEEGRFFDYGGYHDGFQYEIEVQKLVKTLLNTNSYGLGFSQSERISYSTDTFYVGDYVPNGLFLKIRGRQGVEYLTEIDNLDVFSLIGSIAGLSSYIAVFFMFLYRKSIFEYMKKLESAKVEQIVDQKLIDIHIQMEENKEILDRYRKDKKG